MDGFGDACFEAVIHNHNFSMDRNGGSREQNEMTAWIDFYEAYESQHLSE